MSGRVRFERKRLDQFLRFWEPLFEKVPEARRAAVEAMGETVKQELDAQIRAADLEEDAKGTVISWQEVRLGSGGGYVAVSPVKGKSVQSRDRTKRGEKLRQHTYRGAAVTSHQITKWLEKGHGARQADPTKAYAWSRSRWNRDHAAPFNDRTGKQYIQGRMFYSWASLKARDIALRAASRVLERIGDEVDY
ncbi:hypothetical protein WMO64_16240 [Pseudoflavonifractor sp. CLA-AP-H29]|uniref:HK97 gp10 family phage protein n=1 Tax=Pseudoflavonifractor intestinihominis TaxID=3133171 RepID=A0ABV1EG80_9FIRM